MLTVAYLANQFPSNVEPYIGEEIAELRMRGVRVVTGSVRIPSGPEIAEIVVQRAGATVLARAIWLCLTKWKRILPLLITIVSSGKETIGQRLKALLHTFLGACYAVLLRGREVDHIHAHHGYFGSWIALTAARLMNAGFSMTLHGSDLLLDGTYLDMKLSNCDFCITISEYNRNYVLKRFPHLDPGNVIVSRLGVEVAGCTAVPTLQKNTDSLNLLSVGRLHAVKDHVFLLRVCAELIDREIPFDCRIAGDGPERRKLELLIRNWGLQDRVTLLGYVSRELLDPVYEQADVVVLTSRSEGIPLVLMEAMARSKLVLAPEITGIPELVTTGKTGFLYPPGSLRDCVACLEFIHTLTKSERGSTQPGAPFFSEEAESQLREIRRHARAHIQQKFNCKKNLEIFGDVFLARIAGRIEKSPDANLILQQI